MIQINDNLLQEIGLGALPQTERRSLLNHIYETLELRVGMRLADQMTNEQLDEFERYFEAKDDKGAFAWLESNFPNYKEIVQQEFDKLKAEVAQSAPQILSAASQAPQVPQPGQQPMMQPQSPQSPVMPAQSQPQPFVPESLTVPPQPPAPFPPQPSQQQPQNPIAPDQTHPPQPPAGPGLA
jgi:succinate dehydrogenase flavin-adding protein (antitoxin of CptAB toxin-antitoxin module)